MRPGKTKKNIVMKGLCAVVIFLSCFSCGGEEEPSADDQPISGPSGYQAFNPDVPWCTGETVRSIAIDSENRLYAAPGAGLGISIDNGSSWLNATTGNGLPSSRVESIFIADNNDIYLGFSHSKISTVADLYIAKSTDRGNTFETKSIYRSIQQGDVVDLASRWR